MGAGPIPDAVTLEAVNALLRSVVERGRETSEQINDRVVQAAVERLAEPLAERLGEHLAQMVEAHLAVRLEAELEPLRARIAALEERVGDTPT